MADKSIVDIYFVLSCVPLMDYKQFRHKVAAIQHHYGVQSQFMTCDKEFNSKFKLINNIHSMLQNNKQKYDNVWKEIHGPMFDKKKKQILNFDNYWIVKLYIYYNY